MSGPTPARPAAKLFRNQFDVCIGVYDTRRGQMEGRESDKVLAFHPSSTPEAQQSSVVGLAQALTMFAGTFSKDERFHSMEAENNQWVIFNCEPDLWMLMILNNAWIGSTCKKQSLQACLFTLHAMFVLLHGSLSNLLQQDPTAFKVRQRLQPFVQEAAARMLRNEGKEHTALSSPLGMVEGCPFLPLSRAIFTGMQTLVNDLLISTSYGGRLVHGVMVCYEQCLLWSTLSSADTHALYHVAARTVLPAVRAGPRQKLVRRPLASTASQPSSIGATLLSGTSWEVHATGTILPCAPDLDAATPSSSGRGGTGGSSSPAVAARGPNVPTIWLQGGEERCLLLPVHAGPLVLLLLLHDHGSQVPLPKQALVAGLLDLLGARPALLAEQLAAQLPSSNMWHVPGVRYLYLDGVCNAVRASPLGKVATLSSQSLSLTVDVRQLAEAEAAVQAAVDRPGAHHVPGPCVVPGERGSSMANTALAGTQGHGDLEVVSRGAHGCWVASRCTAAGRQLVLVLEGEKENDIGLISGRVQNFCDMQFPGYFDGPIS